MDGFFKWLDRFGLIFTLVSFALAVLEATGAYTLPELQFGDGRFLFIGLIIYQISVAAAASIIAWFVYSRFGAAGIGTALGVALWSFINVSVIQNVLGDTAWQFNDSEWAIETWLNYLGIICFWISFYIMFAHKAAAHQGQKQGGFFFAPTIRQYSKIKIIFILLPTTFLFHAGWMALDTMQF
ncbi:hypothetical protein [Parvularcula sp. IMCC14364]|uniref:hypothetical protein n=1 Tax=Parvularcula sp. IMCC14364 TaxID=3067902 RepID=UPI0027406FC8|nr:hypothetical protein [Parvularcula sp. IMCC14364]